jgi:integral membrane protein (TIGR01906 family)
LNILSFIAKWVFVLCLPGLLLSTSFSLAFNNLALYEYGFEKYSISQKTGLAENELEKAARGLISYFNSPDEFIDVTLEKDGKPLTLFNRREAIHLKDVKGLVWLDYRILLGTLVYVLGYGGLTLFWQRGRHVRRLAGAAVWGSGLTLTAMLALGLGTLVGFDRLFLQFHLISFANDFWQLDPAKDYLIMLFPQGFWYDATLFITLATVGMALILAGVAGGHLWFRRNRAILL